MSFSVVGEVGAEVRRHRRTILEIANAAGALAREEINFTGTPSEHYARIDGLLTQAIGNDNVFQDEVGDTEARLGARWTAGVPVQQVTADGQVTNGTLRLVWAEGSRSLQYLEAQLYIGNPKLENPFDDREPDYKETILATDVDSPEGPDSPFGPIENRLASMETLVREYIEAAGVAGVLNPAPID